MINPTISFKDAIKAEYAIKVYGYDYLSVPMQAQKRREAIIRVIDTMADSLNEAGKILNNPQATANIQYWAGVLSERVDTIRERIATISHHISSSSSSTCESDLIENTYEQGRGVLTDYLKFFGRHHPDANVKPEPELAV